MVSIVGVMPNFVYSAKTKFITTKSSQNSFNKNKKASPVNFSGLYICSKTGVNYKYDDILKSCFDFFAFAKKIDLPLGEKTKLFRYEDAKKDYAVLNNCIFSMCDFSKSNFFAGCFTGSDFSNSVFKDSNLSGSRLNNIITANTDFSFVNFAGADFSGAKFGNKTNCMNTNLISAKLANINNISNANFNNSIYDSSTTFPKSFNPKGKGMLLLSKGTDFSGKELERIKLRQIFFDSINFKNANLKRADLKESYFVNCDMKEVILAKAYAKETNWKDCNLSDSLLKGINLIDAELNNVDMRSSILNGADLRWKNAYSVNLENATYDYTTSFNKGFEPSEHGMIFNMHPEYNGKKV